MLYRLDRRSFVTLTAGLACATAAPVAHAQGRLKVAALFAGRIDDAGFMEAGYRGLTAAQTNLASISFGETRYLRNAIGWPALYVILRRTGRRSSSPTEARTTMRPSWPPQTSPPPLSW